MATATTREQILDAAETLFAEHGYTATSMRQLTTAAGVNLAAVNYHFGGKEELAKAVLQRRIDPINAERHRRLDELENPDVEAILRAFIEPALQGLARYAEERRRTARARKARGARQGQPAGRELSDLFGRLLMERPPFLREFLATQFGDIVERFTAQLARATRRRESATTWWRLHFTIGAMAHTLHNAAMLEHLSGGRCDPANLPELTNELVAFATAGFEAPAPRRPRKTPKTPRTRTGESR